jgi:DNA-binding beta-propeller fold protein YncE
MARSLCRLFVALTLTALAVFAQSPDCNAAAGSPSVTIKLPARPFAVEPSADGSLVFVSMVGNGPTADGGLAVLSRTGGQIKLLRVVSFPKANGLALTHDGKLLITTTGDGPTFLDVKRLADPKGNAVLGSFSDGENSQSIYANVSPDDKLLFVSEERTNAITVINLERARSNQFKSNSIIGKIPTGNAPIALTFSADGKWLFTTSEGALPDWHWPAACTQEGRGSPAIVRPEGAIVVVDVARAATDPAHAVVARVPAGCSAVRMASSPDGKRIYVTARNSNSVLAFDAAKLVTDPEHARLGLAQVGSAPVPVAVVDAGRKVVVGNSGRFAGSTTPSTLTVLDAAKLEEQAAANLGTIAVGAFPREMSLSADGHTLFLTNFGSSSLQVIDVERLPVKSGK